MQLVAGAEHRMLAVDAVHRGAAGAGIALVAGATARVAEIAAAGPLQHVAAERRHVAQLRAGGELQRLGDDRIVALHLGMGGRVGHPRQRAEPKVPPSQVDLRQRAGEAVDVDQRFRPHHVELHQVEQRRSAGENCAAAAVGELPLDARAAAIAALVGCALIGEGSHGSAFRMSGAACFDGGDDVGIGGAAAEVAAHIFADFVVAAGMAFRHRRSPT